jgi:SAM-dependent methyltransferase
MTRKCRSCDNTLNTSFCDLGVSPLSNSYLSADALDRGEIFYPLHARVCDRCFLVQLDEFEKPENIFSDYAYFSSYSSSWLAHCADYAKMAIARNKLDSKSLVVEIASNDGYLLKNFKAAGIPVLGVEPARNVAATAIAQGINTISTFFGVGAAKKMVRDGQLADLIVANNVLAHVPDINDFVGGMKQVLKPTGVITVEFPHLLELIQQNQFDTIYHEHFSYLSLLAVESLFRRHQLRIFDVDVLTTHGGSLRIFASHSENLNFVDSERLISLRDKEASFGLSSLVRYRSFQQSVEDVRVAVLNFLIDAKRHGRSVVGYGAPAKGNTLLNYCGIKSDLLKYTCDISPHKQGKFLPGTRLPIYHPDRILADKPDYVFILPWNLKAEISEQLSGIREWGGKFVVPIPSLEIFS